MKNKILLALIFALLSFNIKANAQAENSDSTNNASFAYAQIVGTQKFLSTKVTIQVDFGQSRGFFSDTRLRDESTGKVQSFNSMVDALNYMALDGWEFVQAYVVTVQQQNVYHYLLRKKRE